MKVFAVIICGKIVGITPYKAQIENIAKHSEMYQRGADYHVEEVPYITDMN